ncbi:hypothetical protein ABH14_10020 [Brevibacillus brevis]|nr:hypothetical protein [Brevibacillus brevis]
MTLVSEKIKYALIKKLDSRDPELPVHDEQVQQGFKEPCFFVLMLNSDQTKEVDRRYRKALLFDVHYFPADTLEKKSECHRVAEQLYEQLEYVEYDGNLYRGQNMRHEVVGDVLHFFVSFDVHLMREKLIVPKMRTLEQEGHIRNG